MFLMRESLKQRVDQHKLETSKILDIKARHMIYFSNSISTWLKMVLRIFHWMLYKTFILYVKNEPVISFKSMTDNWLHWLRNQKIMLFRKNQISIMTILLIWREKFIVKICILQKDMLTSICRNGWLMCQKIESNSSQITPTV